MHSIMRLLWVAGRVSFRGLVPLQTLPLEDSNRSLRLLNAASLLPCSRLMEPKERARFVPIWFAPMGAMVSIWPSG